MRVTSNKEFIHCRGPKKTAIAYRVGTYDTPLKNYMIDSACELIHRALEVLKLELKVEIYDDEEVSEFKCARGLPNEACECILSGHIVLGRASHVIQDEPPISDLPDTAPQTQETNQYDDTSSGNHEVEKQENELPETNPEEDEQNQNEDVMQAENRDTKEKRRRRK